MKRLLLSGCLAGLAMSGLAISGAAPEAVAAEAAAASAETAPAKAGPARTAKTNPPAKTTAATKTARAKPAADTVLARVREAEALEAVSSADRAPATAETTASITPAEIQSADPQNADVPPVDNNNAADAKTTEDKAAETKAAAARPKHMNTGHPQIDALVATHARTNAVPEALIHRVIVRESKYQKDLVGRCGCIGLMQIKLGTARSLGYTGDAQGLHDPDTNLTYGVKYLAGAYRAANGDHDRAVHYFASGYYEVAKRQRLADARTAGKPERTRAPLDITPKAAVVAPKHLAAVQKQTAIKQASVGAADTRTPAPAR
jgi:soluble lytic murein transglycosylase-like protein